jgi:hypothetical protein
MPFISQSTHVRCAVSAVGLNFIAPPETEGVVELFEAAAVEHVDRWLDWSRTPDVVPESDRPAMAARDLAIRRNTAELDPANSVVEKLYGVELTSGLVKGLWGGLD